MTRSDVHDLDRSVDPDSIRYATASASVANGTLTLAALRWSTRSCGRVMVAGMIVGTGAYAVLM
jgi:hypothetical protein